MEIRAGWTALLVKLWQGASEWVDTLEWTVSVSGPWKDFPKSWSNDVKSISKLLKPLKQYPWNILICIGFLRWHHMGIPYFSWYWCSLAAWSSPPTTSLSTSSQFWRKEKKIKIGNINPTHRPSCLNLPHLNQWCSWACILVNYNIRNEINLKKDKGTKKKGKR